MKKKSILFGILAVIFWSLFVGGCTKEPIEPVFPPINDTIDNDTVINEDSIIPYNGNCIVIETGIYFHNPILIIKVEGISYQPEYSAIDTTDYENSEYTQWALLYNGIWYECQPIEYITWNSVDTIVSGENYYIPRVFPDIDSCFSEVKITVEFMDNQYQYENATSFHIYDNYIDVYTTNNGENLFYYIEESEEYVSIYFIK